MIKSLKYMYIYNITFHSSERNLLQNFLVSCVFSSFPLSTLTIHLEALI